MKDLRAVKKFVASMLGVGMFLSVGVNKAISKVKPSALKREAYVVYLVKKLPKENLSKEETQYLIKMREEEKLARDVYLSLAKDYRLPIFRNIARSERFHMYLIGVLLRKYDIADPLKGNKKVGSFKSEEFKKLYEELVAQGKKSLVDALKVGATVEELDIKDLRDALKVTDNRDIRVVYQNLMKASRNHLRAFVRVLKRYGVTYEPKYISAKQLQEILSVKHEAGPYNAKGKVYVLSAPIKIEGVVEKVKQVPGFARKKIIWWAIDVKDAEGKVHEVRLIPKWVYGNINIKPGQKVKIMGYQPPYWIVRGINAIMACKVEDASGKIIYDFSFRKVCKRLENSAK